MREPEGERNGEAIIVGFLHPGEMGAALASNLNPEKARGIWASAARSEASRKRALASGLEDVETLQSLCAVADVIISICPPHAAYEVACAVADLKFDGMFVDANAVSTSTATAIAHQVQANGATFVDAAIIGPPPRQGGNSFMLLSGQKAEGISGLFNHDALVPKMLGTELTKASALKALHSAMSKGQFALLLSTLAAAEHYGVRDELQEIWGERANTKDYLKSVGSIPARGRKSWRFAGEMHEVAQMLEEAGLPNSIHEGFADIFGRIPRDLKGEGDVSTDAVIDLLLKRETEI